MSGEAKRIMTKYPTRIPIIVNKHKNCSLPDIDKQKYLVDKDMNMREFLYVIRKRIQLESSQALFIMINNTLVSSNNLLGEIYEDKANKDGFLYVIYSSENTFG